MNSIQLVLGRLAGIGGILVLSFFRVGLATELKNIEYDRIGSESLTLDLYLPKSDRPLPLIVWIHGGGWYGGDKSYCPAVRQVARGYAVASINYRLSESARFPAQIEDCKSAVRWLRANAERYNLDPTRIAVWGNSAGGHLAMLLGTTGGVSELEGHGRNESYSSRVNAVVNWYGPADLTLPFNDAEAKGAVQSLLGCDASDCSDRARAASPVSYITGDDAPVLTLLGTNDRLVAIEQGQTLYDRYNAAGLSATFKQLPGAGHGGPEFVTVEQQRLVDFFLDLHLKAARAASVSGASYHPSLAPETIAGTFGEALAPGRRTATSLLLPMELASTRVRLIDSLGTEHLSPLIFVSPGQINHLIPPGIALNSTMVLVESSGKLSGGTLKLGRVAPAMFTADASGRGAPAALIQRLRPNGVSSLEPVARFDPARKTHVPAPIDWGTVGERLYLILFGTGMRHRENLSSVSARIGGLPAAVLFAGAQGQLAGLDQVNLALPRGLAGRGEVELRLTVDGVAANAVKLNFK